MFDSGFQGLWFFFFNCYFCTTPSVFRQTMVPPWVYLDINPAVLWINGSISMLTFSQWNEVWGKSFSVNSKLFSPTLTSFRSSFCIKLTSHKGLLWDFYSDEICISSETKNKEDFSVTMRTVAFPVFWQLQTVRLKKKAHSLDPLSCPDGLPYSYCSWIWWDYLMDHVQHLWWMWIIYTSTYVNKRPRF